jgi:hypothetical protein
MIEDKDQTSPARSRPEDTLRQCAGQRRYYRAFPNWQFAALAALAGLFYGLALRRARSTVTTWRMFFA